MASKKLAGLHVDLTANTTRFSQGLDAATKRTKKFEKQTSKGLKNVTKNFQNLGKTIAGLLVVRKLTQISGAAIQLGSRLDDLSQQLDVSTDFIQNWGFAARQTGIRTETAEKALADFSRRIGEAKAGTGELAKVLQNYNISLSNSDGSMKTTTQLLGDYADLMSSIEDPTVKAYLASRAFGESGTALVTMLSKGSKGLEQWGIKSKKSFQNLSEDAIASLARFENTMESMGVTFKVLAGETIAYFDRMKKGFDKFVGYSPTIDIVTSLSSDPDEQLKFYQGRAEATQKLIDKVNDDWAMTTGRLSMAAGGRVLPGMPLEHLSRQHKLIANLNAELNEYNSRIEEIQNKSDGSTETKQSLPQPYQLDPERQLALERYYEAEALITQNGIAYERSLKNQLFAHQQILKTVTESGDLERMAQTELAIAQVTQALGEYNEKLIVTGVQNEASLLAQVDKFQKLYDEAVALGDALQMLEIKSHLDVAKENLENFRNSTEEGLNVLQNAAMTFGEALENSLMNAARNGKFEISDLANYIIAELQRVAISKAVSSIFGQSGILTQALGSMSGGGGIGGMVSSIFGGFGGAPSRALGGSVNARVPVRVGEQGPEMFVPDRSGEIVPNSGNGGTYYIDATGADKSAVQRLENFIQNINGSVEARAANVVQDMFKRNPIIFKKVK
jgi:hypothetical protein